MKMLPMGLATLVLVAFSVSEIEARPRPAGKKSSFSANKSFGLGLMLGVPTGLSGKYYLSRNTALDFGVGGINYYRSRDGLHLHLDHLWHPAVLTKNADFELPLYVGVGARFFSFRDNLDDRGAALGARVPLGISFDFNKVPLDIFIELALVVDVVFSYRDDTYSDLTGALGLRYYFR